MPPPRCSPSAATGAIADVKPAAAGMVFIRCDISREPSVARVHPRVVQRFGRLDALVNNAGIASPDNGPVEKLALREWNRRIGVTSPAHSYDQACWTHLRARAAPLVNIASTRALQSEPDTRPMRASKAGSFRDARARHEPRAAGARQTA